MGSRSPDLLGKVQMEQPSDVCSLADEYCTLRLGRFSAEFPSNAADPLRLTGRVCP
jgi:hypothetical protein